jgi:hypothetical protein
MRASRFDGTVGRTLADSEAWFDEAPHPGENAPNVVVVLLDDTGDDVGTLSVAVDDTTLPLSSRTVAYTVPAAFCPSVLISTTPSRRSHVGQIDDRSVTVVTPLGVDVGL